MVLVYILAILCGLTRYYPEIEEDSNSQQVEQVPCCIVSVDFLVGRLVDGSAQQDYSVRGNQEALRDHVELRVQSQELDRSYSDEDQVDQTSEGRVGATQVVDPVVPAVNRIIVE